MDDQKQQEARWRESLELLGLSEDPPVAVPKAPAREPEPPPAPVVEPRHMEPVHAPVVDDPYTEADEEAVLPESMPDAMDDPNSDTDVELVEVDEFGEAPSQLELEPVAQASPEAAEEAGPSGEEDKPRRGRRRRRRGRRRSGADAEGAVKNAPPGAAPNEAEKRHGPRPSAPPRESRGARDRRGPAAPSDSRDSRDRRGAPKQRTATREESTQLHADERWEDEAPSAEVDDLEAPLPTPGDNEEVDTLADWDVPSWQDLISALYRPER